MDSPSSLLIAVIVFAFISFGCSTYTILRTLLPLLPPHPLGRRTTGTAVGPYAPAPTVRKKSRKLKSAQRFTAYLACTDILACTVLLWEAALSSSDSTSFGSTRGGASRVFVACSARPTILMVVAGLSYFNVVSGKSVRLGRWDWTVWSPPSLILGLGAGLASLAPAQGSNAVWIGMLAFLGAITLAISACFGRLLVAIVRVRKATLLGSAASASPFGAAQEKLVNANGDPLGRTFLPPLHTNFSALSQSFIGTIGRSTQSLDLPPGHRSTAAARDVTTFASDAAPALSYSPSARNSLDSIYTMDRSEFVRSPTPNSARGLLSSARHTFASSLARPDSPYSRSASPVPPLPPLPSSSRRASSSNDHEVISFENLPRPSFGSYASSLSQGIVGGAAMRQAVTAEVWGNSPMPGTGYSNEIDLSVREARGAIIRIGGHLLSALLGYALLGPFCILRAIHAHEDDSFETALVPGILLALSVVPPSVILSLQVALTDGKWFKSRAPPPVLTSSSALNLEQHILSRQQTTTISMAGDHGPEEDEVEEIAHSGGSRPTTPASSVYYMAPQSRAPSPHPGIPLDGGDCEEGRRSALGRAWAMAAPHPKLLVLSNRASQDGPSASSSGVNSIGHARLRSLSLARSVLFEGGRRRAGSTASRATVAGFEHAADNSLDADADTEDDQAAGHAHRGRQGASFSGDMLTRALLNEPARRASWTGNGKKPFGFGGAKSASTTSVLREQVEQYASWSKSSRYPIPMEYAEEVNEEPRDLRIDFISASVLPHLVPSVVVGKRTTVDAEEKALHRNPRRRSSLGAVVIGNGAMSSESNSGSKRTKNIRNLSLPGFLPINTFSSVRSTSPSSDDIIALEDRSKSPAQSTAASAPPSALHSLTNFVRTLSNVPSPEPTPTSESESTTTTTTAAVLLARKDTKWKDRTARAWDLIEARERALGLSGQGTQAGRRRSLASATRLDVSLSEKEEESAGEEIEMSERGRVMQDEEGDEEGDETGVHGRLSLARRRRMQPPPPAPAEPTIEVEPTVSLEGHVVHQGSEYGDDSLTKGNETENLADIAYARGLAQAEDEADNDDEAEVGEVRCASVQSLSLKRTSNTSHHTTGSLILLRGGLTHRQELSESTISSFQTEGRSLTSVGYQNMLDSRGGTWVGGGGNRRSEERDSSGDENHNSSGSFERRRPTSALSNASSTASSVPSPGLRPLRLLGQRDPNASVSDRESDSDREVVKPVSRRPRSTEAQARAPSPADATPQRRPTAPRRSSGFFFPIPPIPDTIDEVDEDRKSGGTRTPTPKTTRSRASTAKKAAKKREAAAQGEGESVTGVVRKNSRRNSGGIPYVASTSVAAGTPQAHTRDQSINNSSFEWPATSTPPAHVRLGMSTTTVSSDGDSSFVTERTRARQRRAIVTSSQSEASEVDTDENTRPAVIGGKIRKIASNSSGSSQELAGRVMRGFR